MPEAKPKRRDRRRRCQSFATSVVPAACARSAWTSGATFVCVRSFRGPPLSDGPTCLVLDIRMPGRSGLELQRDLAAANRGVPIIFITAHADVPMTVQAMKGGAIEFLTKPFRDQELLEHVRPVSLSIVRVGRVKAPWVRSGNVSKRSALASARLWPTLQLAD